MEIYQGHPASPESVILNIVRRFTVFHRNCFCGIIFWFIFTLATPPALPM